MLVRAALFVGTSAAIACSALVDLSGLQGGAAGSDGSVSGGDASSALDGGDAGLVLVDAGEAGDAAPAGPCSSSGHVVCADFDQGNLLAGGWEGVERSPLGSLDLDTTRALSPPGSLLATLPRRQTGAEVRNVVYWSKTGAWRRVRLTMDVFVEGTTFLDGDHGPSVALLYFYSPTAATGANLFFDGSSSASSVESLSGSDRYFAVPDLRRDGWSHVVLDFDPVGGKYTWAIDGVEGTKSFPGLLVPSGTYTMSVALGAIAYNVPMPAVRLRYDNVIVDLP